MLYIYTENLLTLNDMINNVMAKFADVRKGLYDTQYEISGKPPTQDVNTTEKPRQAISLIDLDDNGPASTASNSPVTSNSNVLNDLSDLFGTNVNVSSGPSAVVQQQQQQQQPRTTTNDIFDLLGESKPAISSPSIIQNTPEPSKQQQQQQQNTLSNQYQNIITLVNKNGLRIELETQQLDNIYKMKAYFSNQSTAPMEKLKLQLAVPKSMQIKMEPQSSQIIPPKSEKHVTQGIILNNPNKVMYNMYIKKNDDINNKTQIIGTFTFKI